MSGLSEDASPVRDPNTQNFSFAKEPNLLQQLSKNQSQKGQMLNSRALENMDRQHDTKQQLEHIMKDLQSKLENVVKRQEEEYKKGYHIYVKRKERDLKRLIDKLNDKNSTSNTKDRKINALESEIDRIRLERKKLDEMKEKQRKEALRWKAMAGNLEEDRKMLDEQVKDAKKQNKLLKIAIGRLQKEIERGNAEAASEEAHQESILKQEKLLELLQEASSFEAQG